MKTNILLTDDLAQGVGEQSSSSFVPNVIKTNVPLNNDVPAQEEFLLQRY